MRTSEIILWAFLKQKGRKTKGKINFVNFQWAFNVRARNRQTQTIIWFRLWFRSPCQCSTYLFAMTIMNHDDDESLSASFYSSTRRVCVCAIWKVFFPSTYLLLFHFILLTVLWCAHTRNSISSFAFQNARRRFNFFLLLLLLFFFNFSLLLLFIWRAVFIVPIPILVVRCGSAANEMKYSLIYDDVLYYLNTQQQQHIHSERVHHFGALALLRALSFFSSFASLFSVIFLIARIWARFFINVFFAYEFFF